MLAYYTSLVKREKILQKLVDDSEDLSSLANDLVCELKIFSASCKSGDIESSLQKIKEAEELVKVVNAMIGNLKNNYESYVSSLIPVLEKQEEKKEVINEQVENKETADANQLATLFEAIKSLKEMKESLDK